MEQLVLISPEIDKDKARVAPIVHADEHSRKRNDRGSYGCIARQPPIRGLLPATRFRFRSLVSDERIGQMNFDWHAVKMLWHLRSCTGSFIDIHHDCRLLAIVVGRTHACA